MNYEDSEQNYSSDKRASDKRATRDFCIIQFN